MPSTSLRSKKKAEVAVDLANVASRLRKPFELFFGRVCTVNLRTTSDHTLCVTTVRGLSGCIPWVACISDTLRYSQILSDQICMMYFFLNFILVAVAVAVAILPKLPSPLQPFPVQGKTTITMILPLPLFLVSVLTLVRSSFSVDAELDVVDHFLSTYIIPTNTISIAQKSPSGSPTVSHGPQTTSQSAAVIHSANTPRFKTSPAAPVQPTTAVFHRGAGDPCGPKGRQTDVESTINTCGRINTTDTHAPSRYGVQCLNANPSWDQSINVTSCASNLNNICESIIEDTTSVSQWNWSSGVCNVSDFSFFLPVLLFTHYQPPQACMKPRTNTEKC